MHFKGVEIMLVAGCLSPIPSVFGEKAVGENLLRLPWKNLSRDLRREPRNGLPDARLINTGPKEYFNECVPEYRKKITSQHNLINKKSGVCVNALYCAFEDCAPIAGKTLQDTYNMPPYNLSTVDVFVESSSRFNLPPKVLFPRVASDVVAAIHFAGQHDIELSVKNSGHHYAGGSMKRNTLHVNMNEYKQYTSEITVCTGNAVDMIKNMNEQSCALAVARDCPAYIRIGGGENFDKTYRAIDRWNNENTDKKYVVVGGAAGTVSPMGWTFLGGLGSSTLGRTYGFGADQVLQIEMVLPSGNHVRFGPSKWMKDDNDLYLYPKTLDVTGECNINTASMDEKDWIWEECEQYINFADLWFAVRGGGGGTWGVVLSMNIQLHKWLPYQQVASIPKLINDIYDCEQYPVHCRRDTDLQTEWLQVAWEFMITFFLEPTSLEGLNDSDSYTCGCATVMEFIPCYGQGIYRKFITAWVDYLRNERTDIVKRTNITQNDVKEIISIFGLKDGPTILPDKKLDEYYESYAAYVMHFYNLPIVMDPPPPSISTMGPAINPVYSKDDMIADKRGYAIFYAYNPPGMVHYFAFNPLLKFDDQKSSVPQSYRNGGSMNFVPQEYFYAVSSHNNSMTDFPSLIGSNHAGPNHLGPLKSDWTHPCPITWSHTKRERLCVSQQEFTYGSTVLARLEEIKETIDPSYMFDCNKCIGDNRTKKTKKGKKGKKTVNNKAAKKSYKSKKKSTKKVKSSKK